MFVSVESPYHNTDPNILKRNIKYAILCMKDSISRGEIPYLSHLLLTQTVYNGEYLYVNDSFVDPLGIGRDNAIELTNKLREKVDMIVFYVDLGYSNGMEIAKNVALNKKIPFEIRKLTDNMMSLLD
jgi:hypothetical protein